MTVPSDDPPSPSRPDRGVDEPFVDAIVIALQRRHPGTSSEHIEASVLVELDARRTARVR